MNSRTLTLRRFTFWHGLLASLILHALLLSPWWFHLALAQAEPRRQVLVIDMDGLVSNVQQQQQQLGAQPEAAQETTEAAETAPPPPPPPVASRQEQPKPVVTQADSDVAVKKDEAKPETAPMAAVKPQTPVKTAAPTPISPPTQPTEAQQAGEQEQREQQRLAQQAQRDALKMYLAQLKLQIQNHLEYPDEARRRRQTGVPIVSFQLAPDGSVIPGTVHIERSSGYPLLDQKAKEAALSGSPFQRPPKSMKVAVAVSFAKK